MPKRVLFDFLSHGFFPPGLLFLFVSYVSLRAASRVSFLSSAFSISLLSATFLGGKGLVFPFRFFHRCVDFVLLP